MRARFPDAERAELAGTFRGYGADPDTAARMAAAVSGGSGHRAARAYPRGTRRRPVRAALRGYAQASRSGLLWMSGHLAVSARSSLRAPARRPRITLAGEAARPRDGEHFGCAHRAARGAWQRLIVIIVLLAVVLARRRWVSHQTGALREPSELPGAMCRGWGEAGTRLWPPGPRDSRLGEGAVPVPP